MAKATAAKGTATKRGAKAAAPRVPTARADGRAKAPLTIAGDQAKLDAEREALRAALVATGWNAAAAGARPEIGVTHAPTLSRLIDRLGLRAEYDKNRPR